MQLQISIHALSNWIFYLYFLQIFITTSRATIQFFSFLKFIFIFKQSTLKTRIVQNDRK